MSEVLSFLAAHWGWVTVTLLPFAVNLLARCNWSGDTKSWTAFGVSVVYGLGAALLTAGLPTFATLVAFLSYVGVAAPLVWAGTTLAYLLFRKARITNKLLEACLAAFGGAKV